MVSLFQVFLWILSIDFTICAAIFIITPLLFFVLYKVISQNWTNRLAREMYSESLQRNMILLKNGVDEESSSVLDYVYACINNAMFWSVPFTKNAIPRRQYEYEKCWKKERKTVKKQYVERGIKGVSPEIFYFHHGLRFANEKMLVYIKDKDVLDCGAYVGDSVFALRPYTNKTIYSFEFSQKATAEFRKIMKKNGVTSGSVLIEAALGDHLAVLNVADSGTQDNWLHVCANGNSIRMTTIDEEVKKRKINVGFIKADLEGYGFKMVKGAINTIKTQRPVLSIGIYHNYEELFEIKPFLQEKIADYVFEFQLHRFSKGKFVELTLFCYPMELAD
jgi:FkbM family methyltransferase